MPGIIVGRPTLKYSILCQTVSLGSFLYRPGLTVVKELMKEVMTFDPAGAQSNLAPALRRGKQPDSKRSKPSWTPSTANIFRRTNNWWSNSR
jgi:hypothetical protein